MAQLAVIDRLMARHGRTFAVELGVDLPAGGPDALFQWLTAALLFSARIPAAAALRATRALFDVGWTSAQAMADAGWEARVQVLNRHGYARYDESTSRMLGDTARLVLDRYQGDLRNLRAAAGRDPARERALLMECKGIGPVGAGIFAREAQDPWPELFPFADRPALRAAAALGLPADAAALARLAPRRDFTRLVAALVRCALAKDHAAILGPDTGEKTP